MTDPTHSGTRREAGFTLLELLLVMLIFGLIAGAGLGFFATLDLGKGQSAGQVKSALRRAREAARARRSPACVRLDRGASTLSVESQRVVGTWHFEGASLAGAFGLDGFVDGGRFLQDGWIGAALAFDGKPGARAEIPVQRDPAFDLSDGFALECALRRDATGGGRLLAVGTCLEVFVNAAGAVLATFQALVDQEGRPVVAGSVTVESEAHVLPPETWCLLRVVYDRRRLGLFVDGVPVGAVEAQARVAPVDGPLVLSDARHPFPGAMDALVFSVVEVSEPIPLGDTAHFGPDTPDQVCFDASGSLDRRRHADPVLLAIEFDDGSRTEVGVGVYGTVE